MANDGEQEQLVATAKAEPRECSRWAIICLLGCAGVMLFGLAIYMLEDFESGPAPFLVLLLALLLMPAGGLCLAEFLILVCEQYSGGNPAGVMNVDRLLSW